MTPILKAIIFDVDGTLAETEEEHRKAFNAAFRTFRLPWRWDVKAYRELLTIAGGRERLQAFFARINTAVDQSIVTDLHREKSRLYAAQIEAGSLHARPGVLRLIAEARAAGISLACATPSQRSAVITLLRSLLGPQAETNFAVLGCGDDVLRKKPAPDVYLWVLEQLGFEAESCVVIEDTAVGLAAATIAGLSTVMTVSTYSGIVQDEQQLFAGAMAVISDLGEPHRPFTLLAGPDDGRRVVDISLLQLWLSRYRSPGYR
ncbi:hypothetical protein RIEGSTA812A_PEG_1149 [invertebrate metagenome]|uniref:Beta-phosphoglucomutase n=1 Tax=invertebrate metagenome TaxID=1711999 RepID=A0A484H6B8_9ZZZZ